VTARFDDEHGPAATGTAASRTSSTGLWPRAAGRASPKHLCYSKRLRSRGRDERGQRHPPDDLPDELRAQARLPAAAQAAAAKGCRGQLHVSVGVTEPSAGYRHQSDHDPGASRRRPLRRQRPERVESPRPSNYLLLLTHTTPREECARPIGKNQGIAFPLAEATMRLDAAEQVANRAAWLYDHGQPCAREANSAKFLAADAGFFAADRAVQTHGGFGFASEYHVERYFREARLMKIAPVSQEMVLNYIAEHVLGLPRSY